jgi:drug/metabolite transporter (DMT)-like permease
VPCYLLWSVTVEGGEPTRYTWGLLLSLLYQGVVVAGFNFIMNLRLLRTYKPSGLASYYLTTPLFGVLLSWLILDEAITGHLLLSAGLVVGGIALANRRPS